MTRFMITYSDTIIIWQFEDNLRVFLLEVRLYGLAQIQKLFGTEKS